MADRYQNRPYPNQDDYDRQVESDPLAELARLIGQNDPFSSGEERPQAQSPHPQSSHPLQSRANVRRQSYQPPAEEESSLPAGPPAWMQRARQETPPAAAPPQDYTDRDYQPNPVHPVHRYTAQRAAPAPQPPVQYPEEPLAPEPVYQQDPSRYDDALYGRIESGQQEFQRDPSYPDDPYAYQSDYAEEDPAPRRRGGGMITVVAVLGLAVVGTGAAFAYRTYVGSPRSGEPPIIRADNSPTKVVPSPADGAAKAPDRIGPGDGTEKLVSREEKPVDVNSRTAGPRVVFPALNQNATPPSVASVSTTAPPPSTATTGTLPNNEPRRIRTLAVKGDPADAGAPPAAAKPVAAPRGNPSSANASANGPMALVPQGGAAPDQPPTRMASTSPTAAVSSGGGYVVQVSSQRSEADAQASYRVLQSKYSNLLGSRSPVVKRVDLSDKGKGIVYRAFAGPFASVQEATQVCNNLKAAGLSDCYPQKN